ncbi:unnamed protein product, partial [marine sediment metagenome]
SSNDGMISYEEMSCDSFQSIIEIIDDSSDSCSMDISLDLDTKLNRSKINDKDVHTFYDSSDTSDTDINFDDDSDTENEWYVPSNNESESEEESEYLSEDSEYIDVLDYFSEEDNSIPDMFYCSRCDIGIVHPDGDYCNDCGEKIEYVNPNN